MKKFFIPTIIISTLFSAFCGEIHVRTQGDTPHEQLAARELKSYGKKCSAPSAKFFLATSDNKNIPSYIAEKLKNSPHNETFYIYTLPESK